jgi:hypothetical protein
VRLFTRVEGDDHGRNDLNDLVKVDECGYGKLPCGAAAFGFQCTVLKRGPLVFSPEVVRPVMRFRSPSGLVEA